LVGVHAVLADSDFATAYKVGEHVKAVGDSIVIEGVTATRASVAPISALVGGGGWGAALPDGSAVIGSNFRTIQITMSNYLGISDKDIAATPGDAYLQDVMVLLTTPPILLPSA
jgi:hypothetical protein